MYVSIGNVSILIVTKAHYFESFVGVEATFKDQVNADKRAVKMGWAERIEHREEVRILHIGPRQITYIPSSSAMYEEPMRRRI